MDCGGWVNDINWSLSGNYLAAVSHDSQLHIINAKDISKFTHNSIQYKGRAFNRVCFYTDTDICCGGYDRNPIIYQAAKEGEFIEKTQLDDEKARVKTLGFIEAKKTIFEKDKLGQGQENIDFLKIVNTRHKNTIMYFLLIFQYKKVLYVNILRGCYSRVI